MVLLLTKAKTDFFFNKVSLSVHTIPPAMLESLDPSRMGTPGPILVPESLPLLWRYLITPRCQILSIFTKRCWYYFSKSGNFKVSGNKSEYIKVKSSNRCLDLMHTKCHGSAAPASW